MKEMNGHKNFASNLYCTYLTDIKFEFDLILKNLFLRKSVDHHLIRCIYS